MQIMIEVKFRNGSVLVTDAPSSVFEGNSNVVSIKPSGYCGRLSYDYLNRR